MTITRDDARSMWEQVKLNRSKLDSCRQHYFEAKPVKLGEKQTCRVCGGQISLVDLGNYIAGYVAAGGDANAIWPGYTTKPLGVVV